MRNNTNTLNNELWGKRELVKCTEILSVYCIVIKDAKRKVFEKFGLNLGLNIQSSENSESTLIYLAWSSHKAAVNCHAMQIYLKKDYKIHHIIQRSSLLVGVISWGEISTNIRMSPNLSRSYPMIKPFLYNFCDVRQRTGYEISMTSKP